MPNAKLFTALPSSATIPGVAFVRIIIIPPPGAGEPLEDYSKRDNNKMKGGQSSESVQIFVYVQMT